MDSAFLIETIVGRKYWGKNPESSKNKTIYIALTFYLQLFT